MHTPVSQLALFDEQTPEQIARKRMPRPPKKGPERCLADYSTDSERKEAAMRMQRQSEAEMERQRITAARAAMKAAAKAEKKAKRKEAK